VRGNLCYFFTNKGVSGEALLFVILNFYFFMNIFQKNLKAQDQKQEVFVKQEVSFKNVC